MPVDSQAIKAFAKKREEQSGEEELAWKQWREFCSFITAAGAQARNASGEGGAETLGGEVACEERHPCASWYACTGSACQGCPPSEPCEREKQSCGLSALEKHRESTASTARSIWAADHTIGPGVTFATPPATSPEASAETALQGLEAQQPCVACILSRGCAHATAEAGAVCQQPGDQMYCRAALEEEWPRKFRAT